MMAKPNSVARLQGANPNPHFNSQGCVWTPADLVRAGMAAGTAESATTEAGWHIAWVFPKGHQGRPILAGLLGAALTLHARHCTCAHLVRAGVATGTAEAAAVADCRMGATVSLGT